MAGVNANDVFPKHFSEAYDGLMDYKIGQLGKASPVSFESAATRAVTVKLLSVTRTSILRRRKEAAATSIQVVVCIRLMWSLHMSAKVAAAAMRREGLALKYEQQHH